ncbi:MAG: hypothetical protein CEE40_12450 [Chloroflexi bacterium B3_Chlor]|nr:MAG: hypothetical protein CEE40_12450 [Chloroflexi bacterium B3_Chlor]
MALGASSGEGVLVAETTGAVVVGGTGVGVGVGRVGVAGTCVGVRSRGVGVSAGAVGAGPSLQPLTTEAAQTSNTSSSVGLFISHLPILRERSPGASLGLRRSPPSCPVTSPRGRSHPPPSEPSCSASSPPSFRTSSWERPL